MNLLEGKVAIVTGGSRGIGYAVVKKFLEHGAKVVLCGSKEESARLAVDALKKESKTYEVTAAWPDLCSADEVKECFTKVKESYGKLDIVVNNAGISASDSIFNYNYEDFTKIMDINVNAIFLGSQMAATIMKNQGFGVILNTSSVVSFYGQRSGCGYPTSKFAVNGLTKSLARELGPYNIRVNAVAPGITNTDMVTNLPKEYIEPLLSTIALGRIGEPEEVANSFLYLASDLASYVTGEILAVDGAAIF